MGFCVTDEEGEGQPHGGLEGGPKSPGGQVKG